MWTVAGRKISASWLNMEPIRILYEFDGPRIFICKSTTSETFLAFQCGEEDRTMRFLVVPFTENLERQLTAGEINLYDALMRPRAWIVDINYEWEPIAAWETDVEVVPEKCIPRPGVMLWPHLARRIKTTHLMRCGKTTVAETVYLGDIRGSYFVPAGV